MSRSKQQDAQNVGLVECFAQMQDPRVDRTRDHLLIDVLVIGICSVICGGEGFNDMETFGKAQYSWLRRFLKLPGGIPSHDTFNRVFRAIDPKEFSKCFLRWTQSLRTALGGEIVAFDGKALRRAYGKDKGIPYIVSAWASESGLTLGQVKVHEKSNEITAIPKLLRVLDLAGCIVTIDAMGCQKKIAREIIEADAHYVLSLKGNQGTAEKEVREYFDDLIPPDPALGEPPQIPQ
ncbi:MAG: ISAs1 family transposase, partial [Chloroflexi bacterium]|nr:ISAs1 family transposase [Chloroflexota bacterium]